jgi:hypothetical protein
MQRHQPRHIFVELAQSDIMSLVFIYKRWQEKQHNLTEVVGIAAPISTAPKGKRSAVVAAMTTAFVQR